MTVESEDRLKRTATHLSDQGSTDANVSSIADGRRWVEAARAGDRAAFGKLYDDYATMVHGILLARVPQSEVDDLVQDVFVLALRKLPSLRDTEKFGGWLATIARNRANDFHRRSPAIVDLDENAQECEGSVETAPAEGYNAGKALAAIRSLPEAYRETLILRLVEGMNGPEIAARTGLTHGSVRVNLYRGMRMLREILGQHPSGKKGQKELL